MNPPISAPQLFALSQSQDPFKGSDRCHWCRSQCERRVPHDDPGYLRHYLAPIDPEGNVYRRRSSAKMPGNSYVCLGCQLFRRERSTVTFLNGTWVDRQRLRGHSWWVDRGGAWGVNQLCTEHVYQRLLEPPHQFCLMLLGKDAPYIEIHLAIANDLPEIKGETTLRYTLDNKPLEYTIHELEDALQNGVEHKAPGVRTLFDYFGAYTIPKPPTEKEKKARGRPQPKHPPDDSPLKKVVTERSGS